MAIVDQVLEKRTQIWRDLDVFRAENLAGLFIDHRIDVKLQAVLKHPPERFQNSAFEVEIIFFVKDFDQTRHAHDQTDHSIGVTRKITGQPIIFAEL